MFIAWIQCPDNPPICKDRMVTGKKPRLGTAHGSRRLTQITSNDANVRSLIRAARQAAEAGRTFEADQLRRQAETLAPRHPLVLNETAMRQMRAGNPVEASKLLVEALRTEPSNIEFMYNRALALRQSGDLDNALQMLTRALKVEPGHMAALFEKASIEAQQGESRSSAMTYIAALRMLPPGFTPPKWMEKPLKHARDAVDANNRGLEAHIEEGLKMLRGKYLDEDVHRFDQCVATLLQKRKLYRQQPTFMCYPEMPSIEFYDRDDFPWLDALEAAADDIRSELMDVLEEGKAVLDPYVSDQPGIDVRYYKELNRSRRWGVYPFWREGVEFPDHLARCAKTAAALKDWPKWDVPGSGPTALFSILAPKTHIPAHTGPTNTRLVVHLALTIPDGCRFRVGGEVRTWESGKAFVFDDTINHEAWNDSHEPRAVLIVDTWSPFLSCAERDLVRELTARMQQWYGPGAGRDLEPTRASL